jgi:hypothetical protein
VKQLNQRRDFHRAGGVEHDVGLHEQLVAAVECAERHGHIGAALVDERVNLRRHARSEGSRGPFTGSLRRRDGADSRPIHAHQQR